MGCDIHLFAELRNSETQEWEYLPAPDDPRPYRFDWGQEGGLPGLKEWFEDRNYALFGMLAGVRDRSYPPVDEPRGIPHNVSSELHSQWIEFGEHTPSWLLLSELLAYFTDPVDLDLGFTERFRDFLTELGTYGTPPETLRIVFWFDS